MLDEMKSPDNPTKGIKKNSDAVTAKATAPDPKPALPKTGNTDSDEVQDLGEPVVKGTEDSGPFKADDTVSSKPKTRRADKDNAEPKKDVSKAKLVTKAYESLQELDKNQITERIEAIEAAIAGKIDMSVSQAEASLSEEVNELLGSEQDLSEEFVKKATTLLEAKFNESIRNEKSRLNELYEAQIAEEVDRVEDEMTAKLDSYLDYATTEWMTENKLAIDSGIKTEIAESLISGISELLESHNLDVPEGQEDVVAKLSEKTEILETKYEESVNAVLEARKEIKTLVKENVLSTVCEGLADTEKAKLTQLVEDVSFDTTEDLTEKVEILRENYFPSGDSKKDDSQILSEDVLNSQATLNEEAPDNSAPVSSDPDINSLAEAINNKNLF